MRVFGQKSTFVRHVALLLLPLSACAQEAGQAEVVAEMGESTADERLRILVTNDDGVSAEGIDRVVDALTSDGRNSVLVVAPDGNRSGSGDSTGPSGRCGGLTLRETETASGHPALAILGCPADAVSHGLDNLYPDDAPPHLVLSGINSGQNVSELFARLLSGTVGAARTASRRGVPAVAFSQGVPGPGEDFDYTAGVKVMLDWLEDNRAVLLTGAVDLSEVDSLNIPSCNGAGEIRGKIVGLPLSPTTVGLLDPQNCESTLLDPSDDVEAFLNGFVTQTRVPID